MEKLTKTNVLWRLIWNKLQRLPVLVGGKIRRGNLLFVMLHELDRTNKAFDFLSDFSRRFVTFSLFLFEVLMNQWGEWSEVCPAKFCSHRESESWGRERGAGTRIRTLEHWTGAIFTKIHLCALCKPTFVTI